MRSSPEELARLLDGKTSGTGPAPSSTHPIIDSRRITPGAIFVAVPGTLSDGHEFLDQAFAQGAALAVVSRADALRGRPGILVSDTRRAVSRLGAVAHGDPSKDLFTIGITGTKGKTTTNWMAFHLLQGPALRVGTLGAFAPGVIDDSDTLTTPDSVALHELLARSRAAGIQSAVLEVSAHGLSQFRVEDVKFDVGVFTNLSRDHLDYYPSMAEYFQAKRRFFELVHSSGKTGAAVVLADSEAGQTVLGDVTRLGLECWSVGRDPGARLRISDFAQDYRGSRFTLTYQGQRYPVSHPFIGYHNAENLAGAIGACLAAGRSVEELLAQVPSIPQVPGRLQSVPAPDRGVYVDYAHAPDALEKVLTTLKGLTEGELWVVFGCGGDRDRGKRPVMGRIAAELADKVVITSDNPRGEEPLMIIDEIVSGVDPHRSDRLIVEPDRRAAIGVAIRGSRPGDVVLIAGKGHEQYQIFGSVKSHLCDVEEASRIVQDVVR